MKNIVNKNSIVSLIVVGVIAFVFYFLDKDLSKVLGVAGIFAWFLQEYLRNLLDKDLENYKYGLQNETERFKIQYEKLHTERAEVIKRFYQQMVKVIRGANSLIINLDYKEKIKYKDEDNSAFFEYSKLFDYYEENELYFESEIQKIAKEIFDILINIFMMCGYLKYNRQILREPEDQRSETLTEIEFYKTRDCLKKDMDEKVSLIKKEIEKKFKNIIGIEEKE